MRIKSNMGTRACALLLSGVLGVGGIATGCAANATGTSPGTASVEQSASSDAGASSLAELGMAADANASATATVTDHWSDTLQKDGMTLVADVDVPAQKESAYPVRQVQEQFITQEMLDKFVAAVTPDAQFTVDDYTATKADIEAQIEELKKQLAADLEAGDTEMAAYDQQSLDELQAELATAPEQVVPQAWDGKLYNYGADGEGDWYASLTSEQPDGSCRILSVTAATPEDPSRSQYLMYWAADYHSEQDDLASAAALASTGEEDADIEKRLPLYGQNTMDEQDAASKVTGLLSEMGIDGTAVTSTSRALWAPMKMQVDEDAVTSTEDPEPVECTEQALYLSFASSADGLACTTPYDIGMKSGAPAAPYDTYRGEALVAADGTILALWLVGSGTIGVEQGEAQAILPLSQVQDQLADAFQKASVYISATEMESEGEPGAMTQPAAAQDMEFTVTEARLGCAVIADSQNADEALSVPAWIVKATTSTEPTGHRDVELAVSALDGQVILPPRTITGE